MKFIYRGAFSAGRDTLVAMGVGFRGREPSEATDPAAIAWFSGNPEFEEFEEEAAEPVAAPPKKARRKRKAK